MKAAPAKPSERIADIERELRILRDLVEQMTRGLMAKDRLSAYQARIENLEFELREGN